MKPRVVWVVRKGDGARLADILHRLQELGVSGDGRVVLNGRRAKPDDPVDPGDRVEVWPARRSERGEGVHLLAQRDGVLLVEKPAGLPSEPTRQGESSVVNVLQTSLSGTHVHAASRLDTQVSGVMLCALGQDAARRIERWRSARQIERDYLAIVRGLVSGDGSWTWPLGRSRDGGGRVRMRPGVVGARDAETTYRVLARGDDATLLSLRPSTGRMHQLRAHASEAGHAMYGDRLYRGPCSFSDDGGRVHTLDRIALHAFRVEVPTLEASSPMPTQLQDWWRLLGGDWPDEL